LQVGLKIIPVEISKIPEKLASHQAHLAAAGLRSNENKGNLKFGPGYQNCARAVGV